MSERSVSRSHRTPRQERSKNTVACIIEASIRVLTTEGYDAFNTNRVAEVAGVGIATLYQYFPNKEALLIALFDRHAREQADAVAQVIAANATKPLPELFRHAVLALVHVHHRHPVLHAIMMEHLPSVQHLPEIQATRDQVGVAVVKLVTARAPDGAAPISDKAAWLVVTLAESAIHNALEERPDWLHDDDFVDQLAMLFLGYLAPWATP